MFRNPQYIINTLASRDLNEIAEYFAENNLEVGERFFHEFNRKCQQLVNFPYSGKSYGTIRPDLRGLPLQGYVIFYRVLENGVEILRVVSGRRNFPDLFEESDTN
jgi:toxin ParE1/3/4